MLLCATLIAATPFIAQAPAEPLWITLGATNQSQGLSVPSAGDGENAPADIDGQACRRVAPGSSYLYVAVDNALVPAGDHDVYATVEFYDGELGLVAFEYDKAAGQAYTRLEDTLVLLGSKQWRRQTVHIPNAALSHRENHGTDFRLCVQGLAVRRIEVSFTQPADYKPGQLDPAVFEAIRTRIGDGMELTFGNDVGPAEAALYRALGVTSVESYVTWQTVEDAGRDQWDWSRWDRQVEVLEKAGLKWVPFLIAGPAYANPKWFRESPESHPYVCLEHSLPSKVESLWSPTLRPWIQRFLAEFANRYRDRGVIESVLLGITGIYGESIYPAGPEGGWTADIPGPYHNHAGWWAGDEYARQAFRQAMEDSYGNADAINQAWGTTYGSLDDVVPFLPDKAPSPRARLDMVNWYERTMTAWSAWWVEATRACFPTTEVYLCTGGDGNPMIGADFSAQAKAIAPFGAGIRITNEASDYAANFSITREVATACGAFGTFFGFEPAGNVDEDGVIARIYNATASGALQLHYYSPNILQSDKAVANFRANAQFLQRRTPMVAAGIYLPKTTWALDPATIGPCYEAARSVRDRVDLAFVDRALFGQTMPAELRVLAIAATPWIEQSEARAIERWIAAGHIVVATPDADGALMRTPEGSDRERDSLFAKPPADLALTRVALEGDAPTRFALLVGQANDAEYLFGDWFGHEAGGEWPAIPGATKRWSGARPGIWLPIAADGDAVLTLDACLSGHSLPGPNRVLVNGQSVGEMDQAGSATYSFPVPQALLAGQPVARVTFELKTWRPLDHGMNDGRDLGVALRAIEIAQVGHEQDDPGRARVVITLDTDALTAQCTKRIGRGATVALPADMEALDGLAQAVILALEHPEVFAPGLTGAPVPFADADGVFVTQTPDGLLLYNSTPLDRTVGGTNVPGRGIAWVGGT